LRKQLEILSELFQKIILIENQFLLKAQLEN